MIVPIDTSNRHYQGILEWVAAGNLNCDGIIKHFLSIYGGYNAENY